MHRIWWSDRFLASIWSDLVVGQVFIKAFKSHGDLSRRREFIESVRAMYVFSHCIK